MKQKLRIYIKKYDNLNPCLKRSSLDYEGSYIQNKYNKPLDSSNESSGDKNRNQNKQLHIVF